MTEYGVDKLTRSVMSCGHDNKALDSHAYEQRDGWIGGWLHRQAGSRIDRQTDRQIDRYIDR